jgi:CheY-like chemotaxis protein
VLTDDDDEDRYLFQEAISELEIDYNILLLTNAQELLNYLDSDNETPDIVFLDLNMPGMTGFDALQKIRSDVRFYKIPVIAIYSTSSDESDKQKSLEYGANAFITKPNDFSKLKELIGAAIGQLVD